MRNVYLKSLVKKKQKKKDIMKTKERYFSKTWIQKIRQSVKYNQHFTDCKQHQHSHEDYRDYFDSLRIQKFTKLLEQLKEMS